MQRNQFANPVFIFEGKIPALKRDTMRRYTCEISKFFSFFKILKIILLKGKKSSHNYHLINQDTTMHQFKNWYFKERLNHKINNSLSIGFGQVSLVIWHHLLYMQECQTLLLVSSKQFLNTKYVLQFYTVKTLFYDYCVFSWFSMKTFLFYTRIHIASILQL